MLLLGSILALGAVASAAPASSSSSSACSALAASAPKLLSNLEVYVTKSYPDGTTFTDPTALPDYSAPVANLSSFCRFGAYIHTSNSSKVQFEVWLPQKWNNRFAMVGNGGDAGGVNYPSMGAAMKTYQFAVSSTDTGHNGTTGDGTFAIKGVETQIDFGHRAVTLTAQYSKAIIKAYYGQQAAHNYWIGCSSGGKQGLKELQINPNTFDGVLAGAAAQWWTHLNAQTYRINAFVNTINSTGHMSPANYATVAAVVMEQCDELDGLKDNMINNPYDPKCKPDLSSLDCSASGANQTTCLSSAQIKTMHSIWNDYYATSTGEFIFPGFAQGSEGTLPPAFVSGAPFGPGPDFFNYQVLNNTVVSNFNVTNQVIFEGLIDIADATNPGQTNAIEGNIKPFLSRGKLMTYVGLADWLIPTGSSIWYHNHVTETLGKDPSDSYRLFTVPGMGHCSGGYAPSQFGSGAPGSQAVADAKHDMVLALMQWTEKGIAPDYIVGSAYVNSTAGVSSGIAFQRKLCPYPQETIYVGGDPDSADSFTCKTANWGKLQI